MTRFITIYIIRHIVTGHGSFISYLPIGNNNSCKDSYFYQRPAP